MKAEIMEYILGVGALIGLYLVLKDASATTNVINGIANANTNIIRSLQGR